MRRRAIRISVIPLLGLMLVLSSFCAPKRDERAGRVVLVCIEAAWSDLINRPDLPVMAEMRASGAVARKMIPVFPTNSTPNLVSLATGCYPDKHCAVNNRFFDRKTNRDFEGTEEEDHLLLRVEPLWSTAEGNGIKTAVCNWQGSRAAFNGGMASLVSDLSEDEPEERRVEQAVQLISGGQYGLVMLYMTLLDDEAHFYGPDAPETAKAARTVDSLLGKLREAAGPQTHFLVVSDHGIAPVTRCLKLMAYLESKGISAYPIASGATANLYLENREDLDAAVKLLEDQQEFKTIDPEGLYSTYTQQTLPERYRGLCPDRVGDIILVAKGGTYFREHHKEGEHYLGPAKSAGTHGFDPDARRMSGIFLATGPAIKKGATVDSVRCVDVYPTVCRLLGVDPAPGIDGQVIDAILRPAP